MSNKGGISINGGSLYANVVAVGGGNATNYGTATLNINELTQAIDELRRAIPPQHAGTVAPAIADLEVAARTAEPERVKSTLQRVVDTLKSAGLAVGAITSLMEPVARIAGMVGTTIASMGL
jgi:hypothetical protein